MKRIFIIMVSLCLPLFLGAQEKYQPTSVWPYLYSDFTEGELQMIGGAPQKGIYNIHLSEGRLHFIEDGMIREASFSEVFSVRIGKDYFANVGGSMMKVLAQSDQGMVVEKSVVDLVALNSSGGAYGSSSSTQATMSLSSMEGVGGTRTNMNHMELRNSRDEGQLLPLTVHLYLLIDGVLIPATKKEVADSGRATKEELKVFYKENKIRWKDPQSLLLLVGLLGNDVK